MTNCFPNNNIKTSKDHIDTVHSKNLYCDYANDIWADDGVIYQKLILSDKYKLNIYNWRGSGGSSWNDTLYPIQIGKIRFFDRAGHLINLDIRKIKIEIIEVSKSQESWNGRTFRKMGIHRNGYWSNPNAMFDYGNSGSKYIIGNHGKSDTNNMAENNKRDYISILIYTGIKIQVSSLKLVTPDNDAHRDPTEFSLYLGNLLSSKQIIIKSTFQNAFQVAKSTQIQSTK